MAQLTVVRGHLQKRVGGQKNPGHWNSSMQVGIPPAYVGVRESDVASDAIVAILACRMVVDKSINKIRNQRS